MTQDIQDGTPGSGSGVGSGSGTAPADAERASAEGAPAAGTPSERTPATTTGVIGLGAMGLPMARTLLARGFAVTGFDLDAARRAEAARAGIALADSALDVFRAAGIVVFSLPAAQHVLAAIQASGLLDSDLSRRVVIDTSTSEPGVSRRIAADLAARGHGFLDAPVSGGPAGAATGNLSFMIGGDEADFAAARAQLNALGAKVLHVGPSGAGNVTKLVNNMLVACHMLTTAEGLRLAEAAGVGAGDALRVINAASGRSMLSEVHFPNWVLSGGFDSGFSSGLMRKDLRLALEMAAQGGADLPVAELAR
ncbi:NAD(P)-dependent oxidoreductase, partial [Pseudogemmobacter sonorensis]|uniref:NAD(P)-dependent oxidoreductase n=1 Tax=Pseudogemmobacter sonorensis TaxID=2989681 RepID=UPI003F677D50